MNDLRNEKIARLEHKLLKANRVSREELQKIVFAPQFLDEINARIKAEQHRQSSKDTAGKQITASVWRWQKLGIVFGGLAVFLTGVLSLIFFTNRDLSTSVTVGPVPFPETQKQIASAENPQLADIEIQKVDNSIGKTRNISKKISFNPGSPKLRGPGSRTNPVKRYTSAKPDKTEDLFYPLAYAGNFDGANEDGQIIRVRLTRSSLLALGLNPPMEDETVNIKTDLFIGTDGVARGIRFVR